MILARHLLEDRLRDVVVAAPVGRALGVSELVEEQAARFGRKAFGRRVHLARAVDHVHVATVKADRLDLRRRSAARDYRDELQPDQLGEIGLGNSG